MIRTKNLERTDEPKFDQTFPLSISQERASNENFEIKSKVIDFVKDNTRRCMHGRWDMCAVKRIEQAYE